MKNNKNPHVFAFVVIASLFFIFGFVTWLNAILITYLKIACELSNFESYLVAFAFYISYFVMAIPSGIVLRKTGLKNGMSLGLLIMCLGALLFIPAALNRRYELFLIALFIVGTGLSVLQTASNPYVTVLGPLEGAARRISIMGICNKLAGVLSPIIMGAIVLKDADLITEKIKGMTVLEKAVELDALSQRAVLPYALMAVVLLLLCVLIYFMKLPTVEQDETASATHAKKSVFQFPNLIWGAMALFLYVGAEVLAGDTIINYAKYQGIELSVARNFTSINLIAMVIGYFIGVAIIPKWIKQERALLWSAVVGVLLSVGALFLNGINSVVTIALLGFANALVWPSIWPIALKGLGSFTKIGSSFLIMAIAGGAVLPLIYGKLADSLNPQKAYVLLIPCYLFIGGYAYAFRKK